MNLKRNQDRSGLAGTILVHAIIILLMLLWGFTTPDSMNEDEGGVMVSFGEPDAGGPENINAVADQMEEMQEQSTPEPEPEPTEDPVITNDDATAPEMVEKKQSKPVTEPPEEKKPEIDKRMQDRINKLKNRNSDKNSSSGEGDKEGAKGDPNATNSGPGGTGGGLKGSGFGVNLVGFNVSGNPVIENTTQDFGKVVLDFCVDENGRILEESITTGRGSTTNSPHLINLTKKGLRQLRISPKQGVENGGCGSIEVSYLRQ